jgi:glutaredoxin
MASFYSDHSGFEATNNQTLFNKTNYNLKQKRRKSMKLFSRVILPLILFIYIAIETWAKLHHTSICGSTGCKLAGQLLNFPSIYLNFMGLSAVLAILILGWLSLKNRVFERVFFIALYSAIGFESIMFAYQYYVNPEPCVFCGGVYSGLLLIALVARPVYLLYALPAIAALWIALSTLAIPKNMELISKDGTYLIHSETCPHCKKVKAYFAEHNITYIPIDVHSANARSLLKNLGLTSIPDLLIKQDSQIRLINGDEAIIEHFTRNDTEAKAKQTAIQAKSDNTPNALSLQKKEGCGLDTQLDTLPGDKGGCQQDEAVPLR